ncbi:MAG: ATP-binding protein, partial [Polyangiaceae bacterium]
DGDDIVMRVSDDGVGMAGVDVPTLTERHARGDRAADRRRNGSGLGLPIAKAVIEQHGGRLIVGDTDGGGARVELRLPREAVKPSELALQKDTRITG